MGGVALSRHYDFRRYSGPCFVALTPGDTFRFIDCDYTHAVSGPGDNSEFVMFKHDVTYLVISRLPAPDPNIGRFVFLWPNGLSYETLL